MHKILLSFMICNFLKHTHKADTNAFICMNTIFKSHITPKVSEARKITFPVRPSGEWRFLNLTGIWTRTVCFAQMRLRLSLSATSSHGDFEVKWRMNMWKSSIVRKHCYLVRFNFPLSVPLQFSLPWGYVYLCMVTMHWRLLIIRPKEMMGNYQAASLSGWTVVRGLSDKCFKDR